MLLIRSLFFTFMVYLTMFVQTLYWLIPTLINRDNAYKATDMYCNSVRWLAHHIVGLRSEVRGDIPTDEVLICSKHQSFFDIILIVSVVPRPKFIMKKQILNIPMVGFWAKAIGCVAVDRGKRGAAVKQMIADVESGQSRPGQLIIFPQGTRVAAGTHKPYKVGASVLYTESGQAAVPAATNVGVFWAKNKIIRRPGLAVLEFLPRVEPGMEGTDFMTHLEEVVEENSNRLMAEAGFEVLPHAKD